MRRTERPLSAVDGLLRPADRRPDADDIQPFVMRERRQDGRKPLGHHALARAGGAGEQDIVPAGGRDLERALDEVLPEHMRIVEVVLRRFRFRRRRAGDKLLSAAEVIDELAERAHGIDGQTVCIRGLLRVGRRDVDRTEVRASRRERHGERAAHRTQLAGERKLPEEQRVLRQGVDLACGGENGQQDGQVEGGPGLARVSRGEVDRQARHRPVERAGFRGGAHALSGLADRAGRQSYHIEPRQSARKQTLNRDDISVYAVDTGGKYARDHARSILSEGSCASSVEQKPLYRINIPYHSPFHNTKTVGLHRKNGWKNGICFTMQNGLSKNEKTSEKNGFCCLQSFASVIQ